MERVAPKPLDYDDVLPISIDAKSSRREFFPEGGSIYGPSGGTHPNIIRIPVNADSMLDASNSYIKCELTNTHSGHTLGLDTPQSWIKRVRITSGGVVLEDINSYNRLYGGILYPSQASTGLVAENSVANGGNFTSNVGGSGSLNSLAITGNKNDQVADGASKTLTFHLACGFLNLQTYLPLVMMNAGFIIEIELDNAGSIGVSNSNFITNSFEISDVRYVAHLIDLQRDFYDRLRMIMDGSAGVLQMSGTTYRHYSGQFPSNATNASINIPARVKSIKSILFKNTIEADINVLASADAAYGVSNAPTHGITEYQFRIGSVSYPPNSVKVSATNKGEAYQELRKAFGTLGDYQHGGILLNNSSYLASATANAGSLAVPHFAPYGLDFESFPRSATESGVNSADRSLAITLELTATAAAVLTTVDCFVMCDAVFYVNMDGTCSVSV